MHLIQFSVHDAKAEAFLPPFFAQTVALAIRMFKQAADDSTHLFSRYAEDYTLFEVGSFNCETAMVTPLPTPKNHGLALIHQSTDLGESSPITPQGESS